MIIWINGAFGSGKTTTAIEIKRRLKGCFLYDPEGIGYFLRKNMPKEIWIGDDFQNEILWRNFNYEIIKNIALKYEGVIIIPMTIYNTQYYEEIVEKIIGLNIRVDHYILGASKETIMKRLKKRFEKGEWAKSKIEICINGFDILRKRKESKYIDTDEKSIEEVVKIIEEQSKINLIEDKSPKIINEIRRIIRLIKFIKVFG